MKHDPTPSRPKVVVEYADYYDSSMYVISSIHDADVAVRMTEKEAATLDETTLAPIRHVARSVKIVIIPQVIEAVDKIPPSVIGYCLGYHVVGYIA